MIVTIMSCQKNVERQNAIRKTWAQDIHSPHKYFFFVGGHHKDEIIGDTIYLNCPDNYRWLPLKQFKGISFVRDIFNPDKTFNCDDDTYVVWDRLKNYKEIDYTGYPVSSYDGSYSYAHGGAGFFLSRKAMNNLSIFKDTNVVKNHIWADSLVGLIMHLTGIPFIGDDNFFMGKYNQGKKIMVFDEKNNFIETKGEGTPAAFPNKFNKLITSHFIKPEQFNLIYNHFKYGEKNIDNQYIRNYDFGNVRFFENNGLWYFQYQENEIGPYESINAVEEGLIQWMNIIK